MIRFHKIIPALAGFLLIVPTLVILLSTQLDADPSIQMLLQEAKNELQAKKWVQAIKTFKKILLQDPKNSYAYANLGAAMSRIGNHKKALLSYEKALKLGFDSGTFRYNRGFSFARLNMLVEAEKEFNRALALDSRLLLAE